MQTGPKDEVLSNKARENGLCVSLLERIHALYSNLDNSASLKMDYMASLLTNYRCHEGIYLLAKSLLIVLTIIIYVHTCREACLHRASLLQRLDNNVPMSHMMWMFDVPT